MEPDDADLRRMRGILQVLNICALELDRLGHPNEQRRLRGLIVDMMRGYEMTDDDLIDRPDVLLH